MDIGNGFFMVKFDLEVNKSTIMEGGSWMIFNHYLTVQCRTHVFVSPIEKIDQTTLNFRRGKFARVCVQIDINKPIVGKVWMRSSWYKAEYEGPSDICSTRGCYRHLTRHRVFKTMPKK